MNKFISSFDIDGVIYLGNDLPGLRPGLFDVIITGRSYQESPETLGYLSDLDIENKVIFNPIEFGFKTRESSGHHKANSIDIFNKENKAFKIVLHYEDDPVQVDIIKSYNIPGLFVVHVNTNGLIELENKRHWE